MKKTFMYVLLCSILSAGFSAEVGIPLFTLGMRAGKQLHDSHYTIDHEAQAGFRFSHGERFYSDLGIALYVPNALTFINPQFESRSLGHYAWCDFSLNFPFMNGKAVSAALFSGRHETITGKRYLFEVFKHRIPAIRMNDTDIARTLLPVPPSEAVGASLGGMVAANGYFGASAGWNAHIDTRQEYGIYMQGGSYSDILLTNTWVSLHILEKARAVSLGAEVSLWLNYGRLLSLRVKTGIDKTNLLSSTLKEDTVTNIYGFIEPRIELERMQFDFTFFASKLRNGSSLFAAKPVLNPYQPFVNDLYTGLNAYLCFGDKEITTVEGGVHLLAGANIKKTEQLESLLAAVTPFVAVNLGFAVLDIQVQVYPLLYAAPTAMFEGLITLKREL